MKKITMYSGPLCNFCDAAKRLLLRNNLEFTEIDISTKDGLRDEMIKKANGRSIFEDSPKKPGAKDGKIGLSRKRQYHNHQDFH